MTEQQKLNELKVLTGETDEAALRIYLKRAAREIINRAFPFDHAHAMPPEYADKQVEIAEYLYLRRGSEGETAHSEDGVSRSYENAGVPEAMLSGIVPHCSVL